MSECKHLNLGSRNTLEDINPFTTKSDLIDFTLFNARWFYSSQVDPSEVKGLIDHFPFSRPSLQLRLTWGVLNPEQLNSLDVAITIASFQVKLTRREFDIKDRICSSW